MDTVEPSGPSRDDLEARVTRLETDMAEVKGTLDRLETLLVRVDERLTGTLPNLATELEGLRASLAGKRLARVAMIWKRGSKLWAILGVLIAIYVAVLAALPILPSIHH